MEEGSPDRAGQECGEAEKQKGSFPRAVPQVEDRPKTPSAKRRALLSVTVRSESSHVVKLTDLGLSVSMLF